MIIHGPLSCVSVVSPLGTTGSVWETGTNCFHS